MCTAQINDDDDDCDDGDHDGHDDHDGDDDKGSRLKKSVRKPWPIGQCF